MRFVLDASVALKWVLPEPNAAEAARLRVDFQATIHELIAPDIFSAEVAHALTRAERRGVITAGGAALFLAKIHSSAPYFHAYQPILDRAVTIASAARIGVYDCLYVALAEREGCEFITSDDKLIRNLQSQFPFIKALASLP
jgi:predicted nucleic acid-binding protein